MADRPKTLINAARVMEESLDPTREPDVKEVMYFADSLRQMAYEHPNPGDLADMARERAQADEAVRRHDAGEVPVEAGTTDLF